MLASVKPVFEMMVVWSVSTVHVPLAELFRELQWCTQKYVIWTLAELCMNFAQPISREAFEYISIIPARVSRNTSQRVYFTKGYLNQTLEVQRSYNWDKDRDALHKTSWLEELRTITVISDKKLLVWCMDVLSFGLRCLEEQKMLFLGNTLHFSLFSILWNSSIESERLSYHQNAQVFLKIGRFLQFFPFHSIVHFWKKFSAQLHNKPPSCLEWERTHSRSWGGQWDQVTVWRQKACLQLTCAFLLFQWISKLSQEPQSSQLGTMNTTSQNIKYANCFCPTLQTCILSFTTNLSFTMYRFCSLSAYEINLTKVIRISNHWYWWKSTHKLLKLFKGWQTCAWWRMQCWGAHKQQTISRFFFFCFRSWRFYIGLLISYTDTKLQLIQCLLIRQFQVYLV